MGKLDDAIDKEDSFMGSHQVVKARSYRRESPEWTKTNIGVRRLISSAFPNFASSTKQREAAGRWAMVIHLYFNMGYTRGQIAQEMGTSTERIKGVIRSVYRVSKGLRADGTGRKKKTCP